MKNTLHTIKMMGLAMMMLLSAMTSLHAEEPVAPNDWSISSVSGNQKLEITVHGYPDSIQFGDSIYLMCVFKNVGDQVIDNLMVSFPDDWLFKNLSYFRCRLLHDEASHETYDMVHEVVNGPNVRRGPFPTAPLLPGESRVMYVHTFELPALEDMNAAFWKSLLDDSASAGKEYTLRMSTRPQYQGPKIIERTLTHVLWIKPRSNFEMTLLQSWLSQSSVKNLPVTYFNLSDGVAWFKHPYVERDIRPIPLYSDYNNNDIVVNGKAINPWLLIRIGNRKPPAHLCPTTWQGWKQLEDSLTPSTMRDEIRLTRIMIQYADMCDKAVLNELKDWFADMNEVQRACMAKSVLDRAREFIHRGEMLDPFRDLYQAVREYDISFKANYDISLLKEHGLLE